MPILHREPFSNLRLKLVPSLEEQLEACAGAARRAESESPVARHISQGTGDITCNHVAFNHLGKLRSIHLLGARVIDREGNFIGKRHRLEAEGPARDQVIRAQREKFMPWWEEEFLETEYKMDMFPRGIVAAIFLIIVPSLGIIFAPVGSLPEDCPAHPWSVQGKVRFSKVSAPACLLYRATIADFLRICGVGTRAGLGSFIARSCLFLGLRSWLCRWCCGCAFDTCPRPRECASIRHWWRCGSFRSTLAFCGWVSCANSPELREAA